MIRIKMLVETTGLDFGNKMHTVANSALRLVASMKRDWMQVFLKTHAILLEPVQNSKGNMMIFLSKTLCILF
jgi:hypothetical protein